MLISIGVVFRSGAYSVLGLARCQFLHDFLLSILNILSGLRSYLAEIYFLLLQSCVALQSVDY